jgi:hypothetical protein
VQIVVAVVSAPTSKSAGRVVVLIIDFRRCIAAQGPRGAMVVDMS